MRFIPHTPEDVRAMLATVGVASVAELFADVPAALRERARLDLPPGASESAVRARLESLAARNPGAACLSFLGAGAYPHFVPAVVDQILQRAEFYSAYTPYQPEVSQGTLQAIFEFQSLVAMLFDCDVANASMYDGASATAEAVLMALRVRPKRRKVLVSRALHPQYRQVITTYLEGAGDVEVIEINFDATGATDQGALAAALDDGTAAVVVGYPNFFGVLEPLDAIVTAAHARGAVVVSATAETLALGAAKAPGTSGVDIVVGEGQSLGGALNYGGPGVGLFATRSEHVRLMPGRLVGETVDGDGRRGYVLTLATREQHIRREKATSNICTNQGLMALAVTVHLSMIGRQGLRTLALTNLQRAHAAATALCATNRWTRRFSGAIFNEFVIAGSDARAAVDAARGRGVLAGVPLGTWYPELDDSVLVCATEIHAESDIAMLAEVLR
ncbi:MAG: aminomethyl-transferring glycine dehydrogenase subunit GcvPA [Deltaproteobacteria bacterium]|nr:aminomethyl-transferring glycine dehydrogenase subunit GcvPA [Deltaproteobacteria bacterium]MBI3391406.1 aminomethyl-transferring glycine dehydrogenase subunit GcvPA [Deltaproteobacteria bacterium]